MAALLEVLKLIFTRIADFFEILDLSILLSGVTIIVVLYIWFYLNDLSFNFLHFKDAVLLIHAVIAYILGLMCFSCGRILRRYVSGLKILGLYAAKEEFLKYDEKIRIHGLDTHSYITPYLPIDSKEKMYAILAFLWSEIRQNLNYGYSLSFLKKYWSMSIAFDSILFSTFFIDLVFVDLCLGLCGKVIIISKWWAYLTYIVVSLVAKWGLIKGASTYDEYQNEELLASFAALSRNNLQG